MGDISKPTGLDWVQLQQDMDGVMKVESTMHKLIGRSLENPLVPIGATVTVAALTYGLINFKRGNKIMQQKMMRLRVGAQLFTVLAAIGGIMLTLPKEKRTLTGLIESGERRYPPEPK